MAPLFVTAVYDVYGDAADAPACSRVDAIWQRLAAIAAGLPRLHVFADRAAPIALPAATVELLPLEHTDTFRALAHVHELPPSRSAAKDTATYLKLQCAKAELLLRATLRHPDAAAVVWIDAGIVKILPPQPAPVTVVSALARQAQALLDAGDAATLILPGCWPRQCDIAAGGMADGVRWRFCGGLCFVPQELTADFAAATLAAAVEIAAATGRLTWEVNVWELLESKAQLPVEWHPGDHDASMFEVFHRAVARRGPQPI